MKMKELEGPLLDLLEACCEVAFLLGVKLIAPSTTQSETDHPKTEPPHGKKLNVVDLMSYKASKQPNPNS
jgi:hypothetical protein